MVQPMKFGNGLVNSVVQNVTTPIQIEQLYNQSLSTKWNANFYVP